MNKLLLNRAIPQKTIIAIKWLQREALKFEKNSIGKRVEFRNLRSDNLPSIYDLVRQSAGKQLIEDLSPEKIRGWIDNYKVVFILDGFYEIRLVDRYNFISWIKEVFEAANGCPILITTRLLTSDHLSQLGETWKTWIIEPFDEKRIVSYISKWYKNTPYDNLNIDPEYLASTWLSDPTLVPLTGNPLLLSTLLMVHHPNEDIENCTRKDLVVMFLKVLEEYEEEGLMFWDLEKRNNFLS